MDARLIDARLREAAEGGNTDALYELIRHNPNVLRSFDEDEFVDTPLHIAATNGHADFAMAILNLRPSFARKLNQDVYSPMHLSLQNAHETMVLRLFEADRDLVRVKGKKGYTVLHQAAENGNLQLLAEFLKHCPASIEDVTIGNETALHIAVKNYKLEAVELLARWLQRTHLYSKVSRKYLLNSKDSDGNTALHIAADASQSQMINILVECGADKMATNMNGITASNIIENQRIITQGRDMRLNILHHVKGGFRFCMNCLKPREIKPLHELLRSKISFGERLIMGFKLPLLNLSPERINVLLVILALILTVTFQVVQNPPGGVWQEDASQAASVLQGHVSQKGTPPTEIIRSVVPDPNEIIRSDANYNHLGTSVMRSPDFFAFVALNILVFAVTLIFTIALIEFIAASSFIMILFEILLSSFTCCFLFSVLVISPSSYIRITDIILLVCFLAMFLIMELVRRLPLRYRDLMSCFRDSII